MDKDYRLYGADMEDCGFPLMDLKTAETVARALSSSDDYTAPRLVLIVLDRTNDIMSVTHGGTLYVPESTAKHT